MDHPNKFGKSRSPSHRDDLDVRAIRKRLAFTQRQFARVFGFPLGTLRHWERGNRRPRGPALVLLYVIRENPQVVRQAVRKARVRDPGCLGTLELPKSYRHPPGYGNP